jgi:hypothetical protein
LRVDAQSEACCNSELQNKHAATASCSILQSEACCNSELHNGRNGLAEEARGRESAAREGKMRPAEHECESDISDLAAVTASGLQEQECGSDISDLAAVAASGLPEQECESDISDLAAVAASGLPDLVAVAAGGRDSQMSKQV